MKQKYLLFSFLLVVLISLAFVRLQTNVSEVESSFSPVAANPTNLIDIQKMIPFDFENTSQGKFDGVFASKDGSEKQVYFNDKPLRDFALSPSRQQAIFSYEPGDQELSIMLLDLNEGKTWEIFYSNHPSWDVTSDLHWLGDNNIIFLRHCGTSCQGLTLLSMRDGEIVNATLSYMSFSDQPAYTHFKDWFGKEHKMENFVDTVRTEIIDNKFYLIFEMKNEVGEASGQKKFLFAEDSLNLEL
ncbi:hypothetical protein COV58_03530 [Candidatus Roizmanbacteria bacterium CG11_big_fil_rev_8_21_14_0_20_36_8]|uniref:Uncharacterized protein n=2 Tax=Candidatus Roizmaniibacteriota TaxID=1752723 RepID=A0A2M6ITP1_9BACT|nr:MAG: hypothetical protein COV58_03530 [Candidatus Roizmanbacteria bacterium CG11_big_fil_rev_8_21_14_0_20_36_8]PIZ65118.1 MAG: hypothetical protein COY14_03075 [Candidatus Roizmanbacteria bacterium CG_4_10_14_0_2_um_filter_36_9]